MNELMHDEIALALGAEALELAGGDLLTALARSELRAEIVLAWLSREIEKTPGDARALVHIAALALDDAE